MKINKYGEQLMKAFEMKCGESLMKEAMKQGTFVLEKAVEDRFDEAAWCLITYDIWAISTVEEWKEEFPDDLFINDNDIYTHDSLIAVLKQCIEKNTEKNITTNDNKRESTNMKNSIMNNIDNYVMASRILETLDAYFETNEEVMDMEHIANVKEQIAAVLEYRNKAFVSIFKGVKELEKDALYYKHIAEKYKIDITNVF